MIKIVIADEHELIREGVKNIVRACADMRIVGEAPDLPRTIALVEQHWPEVMVFDISLPGHEGLEGLTELRGRRGAGADRFERLHRSPPGQACAAKRPGDGENAQVLLGFIRGHAFAGI